MRLLKSREKRTTKKPTKINPPELGIPPSIRIAPKVNRLIIN